MSHQKDLKKLAALLKSKSQPKVIFMLGAGVSTSSGIPDFRSPDTGLYHNLQSLNLPYAEAVFDLSFFKSTPKPFYTLAQELYPGQYVPSKLHYFVRLLQDKGLLQRVYTQNIDTLERVAGVENDFIVEAHGSFAENHCIKCGDKYSNDEFKAKIFAKEIPKCLKCKGLVKPDIVFFGEGLPERFFTCWEEDLELLESAKDDEYITITAGTSLTVYPFASLPSEVPKSHNRVLVNKEKVGSFKQNRTNDLVFLKDCDGFAQDLVDELGWTSEFEELIAKENQKIKDGKQDKESKESNDSRESAKEKSKDVAKDVAKEIKKHDIDEESLEKLKAGIEDLNIAKSKGPESKSI
ncbi:NAD-dependent deacetylase sirtuin-2 [Wickerhamomyces ciferrii]|uniref:NAD-dependent protein deacetylase n=1 Tax=Wickerhamomyces ciferrii (strain ATCC 14091 / BCRC 22168 / CBS 111 / JCM 3599 / NBRC 0793 / NRRL Y-1031 F-60-10) TaxID=1206466 RepID=K0KRG9_WICCF|nr:NAD-dependent deacetylase sirtuin-2 [Wickerhamomyces ciferrii]CCH43884.1 NAD-dependent deacetylase sirtuin-2 [Wickerhamomyces ciferrii]